MSEPTYTSEHLSDAQYNAYIADIWTHDLGPTFLGAAQLALTDPNNPRIDALGDEATDIMVKLNREDLGSLLILVGALYADLKVEHDA